MGVRMRSRLEARVAAFLDQSAFHWRYEPDCFANERGQYLPDFSIDDFPLDLERGANGPMTRCYVEVKPTSFAERANPTVDYLARLQVVWDSEPDTHLLHLTGAAGKSGLQPASRPPRFYHPLGLAPNSPSRETAADSADRPDRHEWQLEVWETARFVRCDTCARV
jgi:hypothetical protein